MEFRRPHPNQTTISQLSFQEGGGGWACQHALASHANAVLEAVACGEHIHDQATRIVDKMVDHVKAKRLRPGPGRRRARPDGAVSAGRSDVDRPIIVANSAAS